MPGLFRSYSNNQQYLLPVSMKEWLPEGHLAWFVIEAVGQMNLQPFLKGYREDGSGNVPFHPAMMVTLLIFAYAKGVRSSRMIETKCMEDVAFRVVAGNQAPDHSTLARFRKENQEKIQGLFLEVLRLCHEAGLGKIGVIAVDGTKIAANASLAANRTRESLEEEVRGILEEAEAIDAEEDRKYGKDRRGDELPEELRHSESRLARLREAKERLEKEAQVAREKQAEKIARRERKEKENGRPLRGRKPRTPEQAVKEEAKANVTDPESRIMKTRLGYVQGYNAQLAVAEDQIILAADLTQEENDQRQLYPMIGETKTNLRRAGKKNRVGAWLADAGYANDGVLRKAIRGKIDIFLSTTKDWRRRKELQEQGSPRGRIPNGLSARERMERKIRTRRGQELYRKRGMIVEAVIGQIKTSLGCRQFMRRGVGAGRSEWKMVCSAHNLLKLFRSGKAAWC